MSPLRTARQGRHAERVGAEAVGAWHSGQEAELDEIPDEADDRDEQDEDPPARLVAIVEAFRGDGERRVEDRKRDHGLDERAEDAASEDRTATNETTRLATHSTRVPIQKGSRLMRPSKLVKR